MFHISLFIHYYLEFVLAGNRDTAIVHKEVPLLFGGECSVVLTTPPQQSSANLPSHTPNLPKKCKNAIYFPQGKNGSHQEKVFFGQFCRWEEDEEISLILSLFILATGLQV